MHEKATSEVSIKPGLRQRNSKARLALLLTAALSAQFAFAEAPSQNSESRHATGAEGRGQSAWSGAYAGGFGGIGVSSGRANVQGYSGVLLPTDVQYGLFPRSIKHNTSGGLFGVGVGYNRQSGALVGGLELDLGYVGTSARHSYSRIDNVPGSPLRGVSTDTHYSTDFGFLGTLRARGGYAFGNTLVFGTVGLAAGHVHNRLELALTGAGYTSPDWSGSGMRLGYAVGLGIEHHLTDNLSLKFESLYIDLADRTVHGTDPAAFPGESISYRFTNTMFISRFGINLRF